MYLYHRFLLSYRNVQKLLFERGIDVSHETLRAWCARFGPELAEALRHRKPKRGRTRHLDEMRVIIGGVAHRLWRAVNEYGDVLDVLLQEHRDTGAVERFFRRLIDDHELPERIVTDGLRSYGAALGELPELSASDHVTVSAAERQNNLIEQSHRPTRDQEHQQKGFKGITRAGRFLFTHAKVGHLFRSTRTGAAFVPAYVAAPWHAASACGLSCLFQSPEKLARPTTLAGRRSPTSLYPKQLDGTLGALIDQKDLEKLLGRTLDNDQDVGEEAVNREGGDGPMIRFEREEERTFKRTR